MVKTPPNEEQAIEEVNGNDPEVEPPQIVESVAEPPQPQIDVPPVTKQI
jgi:hypothetical protein